MTSDSDALSESDVYIKGISLSICADDFFSDTEETIKPQIFFKLIDPTPSTDAATDSPLSTARDQADDIVIVNSVTKLIQIPEVFNGRISSDNNNAFDSNNTEAKFVDEKTSNEFQGLNLSNDYNDETKADEFEDNRKATLQTVARASKIMFCPASQPMPNMQNTLIIPLCDDCYMSTQRSMRQRECSISDNKPETKEKQANMASKNLEQSLKEYNKKAGRINFGELQPYCEILNSHLINPKGSDVNKIIKASDFLKKKWIDIVSNQSTTGADVEKCIKFFHSFSKFLVKMVIFSIDEREGQNVLHFAFYNNNFPIVNVICKTDYVHELLKQQNKFGYTPLMVCVLKSNPESISDYRVVKTVFEIGDLNDQNTNESGKTILMMAAVSGRDSMLELLLESGANPDLQDSDGATALMHATSGGHERCVLLLIRDGQCDPTLTDVVNRTASSIAYDRGSNELAHFLHSQSKRWKKHSERKQF